MKLKPCPFCGTISGESNILIPNRSNEPDESHWIGYAIHCKKCPANVYGFENEKDAIRAWNKRTTLEDKGLK